MIEISLEQAVLEFGNEAIKKAFAKKKESSKKRKGSLDARQTKQLLDEIGCYFETVSIRGKGADRMISYEGGFLEKQDKLDGRASNGAKTPYEYEINSLVIDYILKKTPTPMSLNQWLVETGLAERKLTISYYNNLVKGHYFDELQEKYDDLADEDIVMFDHFIKTELNTLKNNIKSVLRKLADKKIIMHTVRWYGSTDGGHKPLTDKEVASVGNLKRDVSKKHGIVLKDLWKRHDDKVQAYWKDYGKRLKDEMGYDYVYEAHGAVVSVADEDIKRYFDKLIEKDELLFCHGLSEINIDMMLGDFKGLYGEHSMERARDRQKNTDNKSDHRLIKQHKVMGQYAPMWEKFLKFYELSK